MLRSILLQSKRLVQANLKECKVISIGYKSQYNLENLYPNSKADFGVSSSFQHSTDEEFSGIIPLEELTFKYSRGGGPGGQHRNKVSTKVEVRFHIDSATWIPDWVKPKLHEKARGQVTKDGYLIVTSDKTRKQMLNKADCLETLRDIVRKSAVRDYVPTEEDLEILRERKEKARRKILRQKREHSLKKRLRADPIG